MSSILASLQAYLQEFDAMELRPIGIVGTDRTEEKPSSYAVVPTGNGLITRDVTGRRYYQNSYMFYARECADAEVARAENWDFLEALTGWLEDRDMSRVYPKLPKPYTVDGIEVSNAMLYELDGKIATYQIQIQLNFYKE